MAGTGGETSNPYAGGGGVLGGNGIPGLNQKNVRAGTATDQVLNIKQRVGTSDVTLFTADETKGGTNGEFVLPAAKSLNFKNDGNSVLGVQIKLNNWTNATTAHGTAHIYLQFLVRQGETINFPMSRVISSAASGVLTGTADDLSNTAPNSNMYLDSGGDVVLNELNYTTDPIAIEVSTTGDDVFKVGDIVRVNNEIMEVVGTHVNNPTALTLADGHIGLKRGLFGSNNVVHGGTPDVRFAFFNAYHDYNKYSTSRTDHDGKFKATNFFGYGRGTTASTSGILPGSIAIKCYNPGYQELGLSGITPSTNSGLTASETYYFNITVDGGTQIEVSFTVDANNTNFGGRNGILSKVQDFFNTQYYTTGSALFETKVSVGIVNGDIRFTSGSYLSTSAIVLAAGASGAGATVRWFGHATTPTGRIPGLDNIQSAVASKLPDDEVTDPVTGNAISNSSVFMYDDGFGNLIGNGSGTINYDTGEVDFTTKANAEFVISATHTGALAGKVTETTNNTIMEIKARSLNPKVEGKINVVIGG